MVDGEAVPARDCGEPAGTRAVEVGFSASETEVWVCSRIVVEEVFIWDG